MPNENSQYLWKTVTLPHDWSVELPFAKDAPGKQATGYKAGGTGWYRKNISFSKNDENKALFLYFEGVYMESEVWVNGHKAGYHPNGYTSFKLDISDFCHFNGTKNEILVKVVNSGKNSRWYTGSGIYRHVKLIRTNKVYLDSWNTFISTKKLIGDEAMIKLSTEIFCKSTKKSVGSLIIKIFDNKGKQISRKRISDVVLNKDTNGVSIDIKITKPHLWSIETPELYTAKIYSVVNKSVTDSISVPFGIRDIHFSSEKGFQLNGKTVKLRGGCVHHDNGLLGSAAIDRAEVRKVELLKKYGYNAVRCSHNPPSEKFLQACDSLGMLVIDEAFDEWEKPKNPDDYHRFFDNWNKSDIESMVRRDRNHPSIIMWSIGNEIQERADSTGVIIAKNLKQYIKALDNTRPITAAINDIWDNPDKKWKDLEPAFENLDVAGYNYMWWEYENDHKLYPQRIIYGSESTAMESAINWDLVENNPYIIGDFVWTAMDYLGESGIGNTGYYDAAETSFPQFMHYPWFNAWCGDIDLCGNMKPQFLYRKVVFRDSKIEMEVHSPVPDGKKEKVSYWGWPDEIASWNWKGNEGKTLEVQVFSRCEEVALFLNGKLIGRKTVSNDLKTKYITSFNVPYQPGVLKAVAYQKGNPIDSTRMETTGKVTAIKLIPERRIISSSPNDLAYISVELVDKNGNVVPNEDKKINISFNGNADVIAGNANPVDMESFRSLTPMTFRGKALIVVRPKGVAGTVSLQVGGENISGNEINISLH